MRVGVMKYFHWAHSDPKDYLEVFPSRKWRYECQYGHWECSLVGDGPCLRDVERMANDQPSD